jgi:uncharacterized protein (DUF1697 family)
MAKRTANSNGQDRLEAALAMLVQNQAAFVASQAETNKRIVENEKLWAEIRRETDERIATLRREAATAKRESDERFARIESQMATIIQVLTEHSRLLELLPEAVHERIGFKAPA